MITDNHYKVSFFVCGAISDKKGFEFLSLGPEKLPGRPQTYLDTTSIPFDRTSFEIKNCTEAGQNFVVFAHYQPVKPNDTQYNRGAYFCVGVGFLERVSKHVAYRCLELVAELKGRYLSRLDKNSAFPIGFKLSDAAHRINPESFMGKCTPVLTTDLVLQALTKKGFFEDKTTTGVKSYKDFDGQSDFLQEIQSFSSAQPPREQTRSNLTETEEDREEIVRLASSANNVAKSVQQEIKVIEEIDQVIREKLCELNTISDISKHRAAEMSRNLSIVKGIRGLQHLLSQPSQAKKSSYDLANKTDSFIDGVPPQHGRVSSYSNSTYARKTTNSPATKKKTSFVENGSRLLDFVERHKYLLIFSVMVASTLFALFGFLLSTDKQLSSETNSPLHQPEEEQESEKARKIKEQLKLLDEKRSTRRNLDKEADESVE